MLHLKQNGAVIETVAEGAAFSLPNGDRVSPAYAGWTYEGFELVAAPPPEPPPPPTLAERREAANAAVAALRRDKIGGSAVIGGVHMWVDIESRANLTAAVLGAQLNPQVVVQWKTADGAFVSLDATQLATLATAVMGYVQGCFVREAELRALIAAAEDPEGIDITTGWPG